MVREEYWEISVKTLDESQNNLSDLQQGSDR